MSLNLTTTLLEHFIGGDLEVIASHQGSKFRGPIRAAAVTNYKLVVQFNWLAQNKGQGWELTENFDYELPIEITDSINIKDGTISITSSDAAEAVKIFPPSENNLAPEDVSGLTTNDFFGFGNPTQF